MRAAPAEISISPINRTNLCQLIGWRKNSQDNDMEVVIK